jgi:hypothetical protein
VEICDSYDQNIGLLRLISPYEESHQDMFKWTWSSGDYTAEGTFSTPVTSGSIYETDVTSHMYSVFHLDTLLYTIDLVDGVLDLVVGINGLAPGRYDSWNSDFVNYHDFEDIIGNSSFESNNSSVLDPAYPVDFTVTPDNNVNFFGLSYEPPGLGGDAWFLNYGPFGQDVAMSNGFDSGPIVTAVDPLINPVYRFFNTVTGGHFFTASEAERDSVLNNLPQYLFEGVGFEASIVDGPDLVPIYRFFNPVEGGHFFTASETERSFVLNNLPQFLDEGIGFYAYGADANLGADVFRFFNSVTGVHFFTTSESERDVVLNSLPQYIFEGVGFEASLVMN